MRKYGISLSFLALLLLPSCARDVTHSTKEKQKTVIDSASTVTKETINEQKAVEEVYTQADVHTSTTTYTFDTSLPIDVSTGMRPIAKIEVVHKDCQKKETAKKGVQSKTKVKETAKSDVNKKTISSTETKTKQRPVIYKIIFIVSLIGVFIFLLYLFYRKVIWKG